MAANQKLRSRIWAVWGYHPDKFKQALKDLGIENPEVERVIRGEIDLSDEDKRKFAMALSCLVDEIF